MFFKQEWCFCHPCLPGTYQPAAGQTSCIAIPPGRALTGIKNTASGIPCTAGSFASQPGSSACSTCTSGTYAQNSGSSACASCSSGTYSNSGSSTCLGAAFQTNGYVRSALYESDAGALATSPALPNLAVGDDIIVIHTNGNVGIFNKTTLARISVINDNVLIPNIPAPGDTPSINWDTYSKRFFLTRRLVSSASDATLTIAAPSSAQGVYPVKKSTAFGAQTFSIPAGTNIVVANPLLCGSALNNTAQLVGAICVCQRGVSAFTVKAKNCQNAGAIAMVVIDNANSTFDQLVAMGGVDATITIPGVFLGFNAGQQLLAGLPAQASLASFVVPLGYTIGNRNLISVIVSKVASPRLSSDFQAYTLVPPIYNDVNPDYPRVWVDATYLWYSVSLRNNSLFPKPLIIAFDKASLLNGTGMVIVSQTLLPNENSNYFPSQQILPVQNPNLPTVFIGYAGTATFWTQPTAFRIYGSNDFSHYITIPFPAPLTLTLLSVVPQPDPSILGLDGLTDFGFIFDGGYVVKQSLWLVVSWAPFLNKTVARWHEFDLSMWPTSVSLKQWGDVDPGPGLSVLTPSISADKDGNAFLQLGVVGTSSTVEHMYTGRLKGDPLNTMRSPLQLLVRTGLIYNRPNTFRLFNSAGNTTIVPFTSWGLYGPTVLDPVDLKTLYFCQMLPSDRPADITINTNYSKFWSVSLGSMTLNLGTPYSATVPTSGSTVSNWTQTDYNFWALGQSP